MPPNLGQFDVHWSNNPVTAYDPTKKADIFQVEMANQYVDVVLYTTGTAGVNDEPGSQPFWAIFDSADWYPIASSRQQLQFHVTGMHLSDPTKKGTAASQKVDVTNEDARGGIYYWTTSSPQGIYRYDVATPEIAARPMFLDGEEPGGNHNCMGCHSMSRDGKKLALTIDGGGGRGTVIDVATRAVLVPYESPDGGITPVTPVYWNFATFAPDGEKLVTVSQGIMTLRDANGGAALTTIDNGTIAVDDGTGTGTTISGPCSRRSPRSRPTARSS